MKRLSLLAGVVSLVLGTTSPIALAQTQNVSGGEERLTIAVGDVFEMVADAGEPSTSSWILTQERTFIEAGRDRLFRYRFVQENDYTLLADITLTESKVRIQRTFRINVVAADDPSVPVGSTAGTGANLANVSPSADPNGRVILSSLQRVIRLAPTSTDYSPLALDLDATRDTDGDGNSENDVDNTETYFQSFGRSLWIWFARPITKTDLIVTAVPSGQSPLVQRITVATEETAREEGLLTSPVEISVEQINESTFSFAPTLGRAIPASLPLLYIWEFGDGLRSLETRPTHEYAAAGVYAVKLSVRDLQTGNTIGTNTTTVMPTGGSTPEPDPTEEDPDPVTETPTDPEPDPTDGQTASPTPWGRYALIGGLFVVSLLIGIAIVWLLSFLRRSRRLEQTLETMEKAIAPEAEKTPPPLAIKGKQDPAASTEKQKVIDAEISAAAPATVSNPPVTDAVAPDWLKKGLAADQKKPASAPAPAAAPSAQGKQPSPPAPKPTPAPKRAPASPPPKPATTPPAPKPAAPAPAPKPPVSPPPVEQAAAPKPQATAPAKTDPSAETTAPAAKPVSATEQIPNDHLPHWLKPNAQPATEPQAASPSASAPPMPAAPPKAPTPPAPAAPKPATPPPAPKPVAPPTPPRPTVPPAPPMPKEALRQTPPVPAPTTTPAAPKPNPVPPAPPMPAQTPPPAPTGPSSPAVPPPPPPPALPAQPKPDEQKKDDDPPIAFIRAENINPGPAN